MAITKLRLTRFRGFENAELPIAPLTVVLGPNSSGKSSFSHALATLSHAHRNRTASLAFDPPRGPSAPPIDLGDLDSLRTTGTEGDVAVGLLCREGWMEYFFGHGLKLSGLRVPHSIDDVVESTSTRSQNTEAASLEGNHVYDIPNVPAQLSGPDFAYEPQTGWRDRHTGTPLLITLDGLRVAALNTATGQARSLNTPSQAEIGEFLSSFRYLKATRHTLRRGEEHRPSQAQERLSVGYRGDILPSILDRDAELPFDLTTHLPTLDANIPHGWGAQRGGLATLLGAWLRHLGLAGTVSAKTSAHLIRIAVSIDSEGNERMMPDVGFGVTQVLPVLAEGLLMPVGATLAVDLPEAHLHPRPQWLLADFFCSLVKSGKRALVETHSEAFFNRLRMWAEIDASLAANISVCFLDGMGSHGRCTEPRRIELTQQGEVQWPRGFMAEGLATELALMQIRARRSTDRSGE